VDRLSAEDYLGKSFQMTESDYLACDSIIISRDIVHFPRKQWGLFE
jgi:hypothetical protein